MPAIIATPSLPWCIKRARINAARAASWLGRSARRVAHDENGAAMIEFALAGPIFFAMIFAMLELPLIGWNHEGLSRAAVNVREYMEQQRMERKPIEYTRMREVLCDSLTITTISCDPAKLKMNLYNASAYGGKKIVGGRVPAVITGEVYSGALYPADSYIIVLAYDWTSVFPTSKLFLPHDDKRVQIQASSYVLLTKRPYDNL